MNQPATDARGIDHALARWVRERSGSQVLARAAFAVSLAEGQGHACAALGDDAPTPADIAALREQAWVGVGGLFTPFVLDEYVHFYTWRTGAHENWLAKGLRALAHARTLPVAGDDLAADLNELFGSEDPCHTLAACRGSSGAGVTPVRAYRRSRHGQDRDCPAAVADVAASRAGLRSGRPAQPLIALAAPTGKAAQRLAQAISYKQPLHSFAPTSGIYAALELVPDAARTLHRLLGFRPRQNIFARNARDPLAADIVVVDEASMVDLAVMRQLVEALRPLAILILLGDPGQLAAVEAGSVLSAISSPVSPRIDCRHRSCSALLRSCRPARRPAIRRCWPDKSSRLRMCGCAGSGLQRSIHALRAGDEAWLDAFLASGSDGSLSLHACADAATLRARADAWIDAHAAALEELTTPGISPEIALVCLRRAQILCALREGAFGAQGINAFVARRLAARFGFDPAQPWYHGRPVLVTQNDYGAICSTATSASLP